MGVHNFTLFKQKIKPDLAHAEIIMTPPWDSAAEANHNPGTSCILYGNSSNSKIQPCKCDPNIRRAHERTSVHKGLQATFGQLCLSLTDETGSNPDGVFSFATSEKIDPWVHVGRVVIRANRTLKYTLVSRGHLQRFPFIKFMFISFDFMEFICGPVSRGVRCI